MVKKITDLQKKKGKKGFSMIELIIVIAIMAILIALIGTQLIPYLEKSRKSKDLTTMDTCLSNFQTALSSVEASPTDGTKCSGIAALDGTFGSGTTAAYKEVAGTAYETDSKLNAAFKSKAAKNGSSNVEFGVGNDSATYGVPKGMVFVKKGDLIACSAYSGELSNGSIPSSSTSGSGSGSGSSGE